MRSSRPRSYFWPLHLGGWAAFALAMAVGRAGERDAVVIAATEPVFAGLAALVTAAMRLVYVRFRVGSARPAVLVAVGLAVSYVGALAWTAGYYAYLHGAAPALLSLAYAEPLPPLRRGPVLDGAVYHWAILLGWSALYVGLQYYAALQQERERVLRAEALAHQARLRALRYQLNPHFLFNALNGISTLVTEVRTREATNMIAQLSDFLRLTLEKDGGAEVPLADEVDFARRYLDIEQARFGERLRVRIDVEPDVLAAAVPALVLQPLVENAVKYAVAPREEGGRVSLEARREGGALLLAVGDDGPGLNGRASPSEDAGESEGAGGEEGLGLGLANVRDRLLELYGDAARMELDASGVGLRVVLRLPLRLPAPSAP